MSENYIAITLIVVFVLCLFAFAYGVASVITPRIIKIGKIIDLKLDEMLNKASKDSK